MNIDDSQHTHAHTAPLQDTILSISVDNMVVWTTYGVVEGCIDDCSGHVLLLCNVHQQLVLHREYKHTNTLYYTVISNRNIWSHHTHIHIVWRYITCIYTSSTYFFSSMWSKDCTAQLSLWYVLAINTESNTKKWRINTGVCVLHNQ